MRGTMMMRMRAAAIVAAIAATTGCLERKERVTVRADGAVDVELAFKGDAAEFDAAKGDTLPTGGPWHVSDKDVLRDDGHATDHVREAAARFARADEYRGFGAAGDRAALAFSNSLAISARPDGSTRFVFERRYAPRAYAWRERLFKRAFPDALKKELENAASEAKGAPLPEPLVRRAVEAILAFEREKQATFAEAAVAGAGGDAAARLIARSAFVRTFGDKWQPEPFHAAIFNETERAKLDARFQSETASDAVRAALDALAPAAGDRAALEAKLAAAFANERRVLAVTEALRVHQFEVKVAMPVAIVAHDADAIEDDGRTAVFKFNGEELDDHERTLRVVAEGRP